MEENRERERLIQYAVIIKENNFPYKKYVWISKSVIVEALKPYTLPKGVPGTKHIIDMAHIVFEGKPEDIKNSKKSARAEFIEGNTGSLELHVDADEDAIKCLKYLKLR